MTLTFDLATWFLFATHHFFIMIISANYFEIPPCTDKVFPDTNRFHGSLCKTLSANCDLDLRPSDIFLFAKQCLVMIIIFAE